MPVLLRVRECHLCCCGEHNHREGDYLVGLCPRTRLLSPMRLLSLFLGLVAYEVLTACCFTWLAQRTNRLGLAWVCLGFWLLALGIVGWLYRKQLPLPGLIFVLVASPPVSLLVYFMLGYHVFGWHGLMKP
jgi:hypothetical protein